MALFLHKLIKSFFRAFVTGRTPSYSSGKINSEDGSTAVLCLRGRMTTTAAWKGAFKLCLYSITMFSPDEGFSNHVSNFAP